MLTAISPSHDTPHEVVDAFQSIGLPLNRKLEAMLNEHPEHQRPRRGCGFTQASRLLAEYINQPRSLTPNGDLQLFSEQAQKRLLRVIAIGTAVLSRPPTGVSDLRHALEACGDNLPTIQLDINQLFSLETLESQLQLEESRLIVGLILSLLGCGTKQSTSVELNHFPDSLAIGTCPEAERYFLEFAGGYLRRQGIINILTDNHNRPVAVEKINVGDSHSCITLRDVCLNGTRLPAGSLIGTTYNVLPIHLPQCAEFAGVWMPLSVCEGFRFLRLTTLAVSPENRTRAFSNHLKQQLEGSPFFDPLNTRLAELEHIAKRQYQKAQ